MPDRTNRPLSACIAAAFALAVPCLCAAQPTPAAPAPVSPKPGTGGGPPPPYTPVRYNEDYSYLKDPAKRTDFFDPIKYIPLNEAGDVYLSLGGQFRERYEYFNNANFDPGPQDEHGYFLHRLMAHADLHVGPHFRGFLQLYSALEDRRDPEPRPQDVNEFDVHQAFLDFKLPLGEKSSVTFRGGRRRAGFGLRRRRRRILGQCDAAHQERRG